LDMAESVVAKEHYFNVFGGGALRAVPVRLQ
jgi:hypothetical protein